MAKKATFFAEVHENLGDKILEFCGQTQISLYRAWVQSLDAKQIVEVTFEKRRHAKTNPQLGYWYGVLMPFAVQELREAGYDTLFDVSIGDLKTGVETNKDTCDLLFKTLFKAHKQMPDMPLKRDMSDAEMSELIDFALQWLAKNLGAVAPVPEEKP